MLREVTREISGKEFLENFPMHLHRVINKIFVADQKMEVEKEDAGEGVTEEKEALDRQILKWWCIEGLMDFAHQKQS